MRKLLFLLLAFAVAVFEVPLGCQAAEGFGCGSMAKPILRELEGKNEIAEARINHPGTLLAVVWKDPARSGPGHAIVVIWKRLCFGGRRATRRSKTS